VVFDGIRMILALIIFAAALGGYWVGHTGRAKIFITIFLVIASLASIFAWNGLPSAIPIYICSSESGADFHPFEILVPNPPDKSSYNLGTIIDQIKIRDNKKRKPVIVYEFKDFPMESEYLLGVAYSRGKRLDTWLTSWREIDTDLEKIDFSDVAGERGVDLEPVEEILIFHPELRSPGRVAKNILKSFPGIPYELIKNDIGGGYTITVIRLRRDED